MDQRHSTLCCLPAPQALMAVCERVGSPAGEAMLEAYKPQPYTQLVEGKTMAQVRRQSRRALAYIADSSSVCAFTHFWSGP